MIVAWALSLVFCAGVWATDRNAVGTEARVDERPAFVPAGSSESAVPHRNVTEGDIPAGYKPQPAAPAVGEPPQVGMPTDGGTPVNPKPLWGADVLVRSGSIGNPSPPGSERMIAYDQTHDGILFAACVVSNRETIYTYRSTNGGNTWTSFGWVAHPGNVLTSPELVVAEGDSSFVFLFFRTSANNGDIYCVRRTLSGSPVILMVKADADTIVNLAACKDFANQYYLYVTFELRNGEYNVYTWRSTNYGRTWAEAGASVIADTRVPPKPDICVGNSNRVYVFCLDKRQSSVDSASFRMKLSTDRGANWENSVQVGVPAVRVFDGVCGAKYPGQTLWLVHVRDMEPWNGKGLGVFYYYSTNNGTDWFYAGDDGIGHVDTDNNEQMPSIATAPSGGYPTVCYAIVPSESLMFTWASGDTNWTTPIKVNDHRHTGNFPPAAGWKNVGAGAQYSCVLYAGVGPTDLWFDAWSMVGVEEPRSVPAEPLATVRPSPATEHAVISYALSRPGPVQLVIHDVTGRTTELLTQGTMAAGRHEAVWNCQGVQPGVYLYRLVADGTTRTGRIVVAH